MVRLESEGSVGILDRPPANSYDYDFLRAVGFRNSVEFNLAPQRCHLCPSFWPQAQTSPKSCSNAPTLTVERMFP